VPEHRVAAVVPALDEAAAIGGVVAALRAAGACCVFVVDGGSRDGTPAAASGAGAVVLGQRGRGYGAACAEGLLAAAGHEWLAVLDGDGSCDGAELRDLLAGAGAADLVLGRRTRVARGAMPWHARLGNRLVAELLRLRTGARVHDLPPFKLVRGRAAPALALHEPGYGWTVELIGRALASPWLEVREVPVSFAPRAGGESKVSGRPLASARAAKAMLAHAVTATRRRGLLVLMAKAPGPGRAKTRLAGEIGEEAAAHFWTSCLERVGATVRAVARAAGADAVAMVPAEADRAEVQRLTGLACAVQERPGLGHALAESFGLAARARARWAAVLGADVPTLPQDVLPAAFAALARREAVIGPCEDGGYYLLGMPLPAGRSLVERLFLERPLGGADALDHVRAVLPGAAELRTWYDVDRAADLARSGWQAEPEPRVAGARLGAHAAAGLLDELLDDGQPDAGAPRRPVP
jgi:glycosyltransferase A (GT-A) superfamily protein (DUF2064 family)